MTTPGRPTLESPIVVGPDGLAPEPELDVLVSALVDHEPTDEQQAELVERMLRFARSHPDALVRTCVDGHFTGSALVVDADAERFIVLHHAKLSKWLQPGGHTDGDANLAATALREATEETGIDGLRVVRPAVDLDIHEVRPPTESAHLHLDVRFLVVAPVGAEPIGNHESNDIRWATIDDLGALDADEGLRRLAVNGLALARRLDG